MAHLKERQLSEKFQVFNIKTLNKTKLWVVEYLQYAETFYKTCVSVFEEAENRNITYYSVACLEERQQLSSKYQVLAI